MRNVKMAVRLPRVLAVLAVLASVLALGACGSSGGSTSSATVAGPLASAAYATSRAGGAHMALSARIESGALPSAVTLTGGGFFNYSAREGSLAMTIAGLPANPVIGSSAGIEELFKGTDVYVGSSLFAGKLPGGARWMKLDLARVGAAAGIDPARLLGGQSNPAQFLEYLKAGGGSVQVVGHEAVRGVPTTRYHGTIDLRKAAAVLTEHAPSSALRKAFEAQVAKIGLTSMPVDVWVDSRHLVRRLQLSLDIPAGGQHASMNMTIELFNFGGTPSVTPPSASETFDASTTLGGLSAIGR
jgi:hypothetical protein